MSTGSSVTRTRRALATLTILSALVALSPPAQAATWLLLHRGASAFAFDGVERDHLARGLDRGSTETGLSWGGALGWDVGAHGLLGIGYERLLPEVDGLGRISGLPLTAVDLEAEVVRAFLEVRSVRSGGQEVGLGAGLGWLRTQGFLMADYPPGEAALLSGELDGDDLVAEVYATLDAYIARRIALQVAGGYRHAPVDNAEVDRQPLVRADNSAVELDYSGFFGRLGVRLGFAPLRAEPPRAARSPGSDERDGVVMVEVGAAVLGALPAKYFDDGEGAEGGYLATAGWRGGRTAIGFGLRDEVWRDLTQRKVTVEDGRLFGYLAYHPYDLLTGPFLKIEAGAWEKLRPGDAGGDGELLPFLGLGSGYRVQLLAGLGLYAEGMTISRAGDRPSLEARIGTSLLLGG